MLPIGNRLLIVPSGASNKQSSIGQQWFVLRVTTRDPVNRGSRLLLMLHSRPYLHSRFCDKIRFVLIFTWAHRYRKHDLMDLTGSTSGLNLLNRSRHRLYIVFPVKLLPIRNWNLLSVANNFKVDSGNRYCFRATAAVRKNKIHSRVSGNWRNAEFIEHAMGS